MKKNKKLTVIIAIIVLLLVVAVGSLIYQNYYVKKNWDTRKNVSKELRDYQTYWICTSRLCKVKDGYYIVGKNRNWSGTRIFFWDGKSSEYDIICDVPNCSHSSNECSAWLSENAIEIQYSNGYIFYSDWDEENNEWLYRCEIDGTNRQPMLLLSDHNEHAYVSNVYVHGNHILVTKEVEFDDRTEMSLIDYNMKNKKKSVYEVVKTGEAENLILHDVLETKVLYGVSYDGKTDICEYDIETKTSVCLRTVEGLVGFINYVGTGIAYNDQNKSVLFKDGKEILLNEGEADQIGCDGRYLYIDNVPMFSYNEAINKLEHTVKVFDFDGNLLHTIKMPENTKEKMQVCYFGDGEKLFVSNFTDTDVYVIDVDDLEKGEWTAIDVSN